MWLVKTILNPRDFSERSREAHQTACDIARQHKARLICLHVADKPVVSYIENASELPPEALQEKLWETLRWPRDCEKGLQVEHRVAEGDTVDRILRMAEETKSDLLVISTQGKTGIVRWFSGSTAEELIRRSPCSVLVVKVPSAAGEPEAAVETAAETEDTAPVTREAT
jgi:nucleotide-binding universal stress UspA family protein